jgi:hypothetical protein
MDHVLFSVAKLSYLQSSLLPHSSLPRAMRGNALVSSQCCYLLLCCNKFFVCKVDVTVFLIE